MVQCGIYRVDHSEGGKIGLVTELVGVCCFESGASEKWFSVVAKYCALYDFVHRRFFGEKQYLVYEVSSEDLEGFDCGATFYYGRKPIVRGLDMLKCSGNIPEGFLWFLHFCDFVQDYEAKHPSITLQDAIAVCYKDWEIKKEVSTFGCFA